MSHGNSRCRSRAVTGANSCWSPIAQMLDQSAGAALGSAGANSRERPGSYRRWRVTRLAEFLHALDGALRGEESFDGQIYRFSGASWSPGPVQQPRPPIAVGAVGPRMLRLAAEQADVWSAFGGIAVDDE